MNKIERIRFILLISVMFIFIFVLLFSFYMEIYRMFENVFIYVCIIIVQSLIFNSGFSYIELCIIEKIDEMISIKPLIVYICLIAFQLLTIIIYIWFKGLLKIAWIYLAVFISLQLRSIRFILNDI